MDEKCRATSWHAPQKGWIKINFDEASLGNPRHARVACIAKDDWGHTIGMSAEYIGKTTNNISKFRATLIGVELARRLGAKKIYLKGDSLLTINAIRNQWMVNR